MLRLDGIIFALVILHSIIVIQALKSEVFSKEWTLDWTKDLTIKPIKDNIFPYAKCEKAEGNERNCAVVLETFDVNGTVAKDECQIHFHTEKGSAEMLHMQAVHGKNIVFSYTDVVNQSQSVQVFRVIDMTTCKFNDLKIASDPKWQNTEFINTTFTCTLAYNDNSFDVFIMSKGCKGGRCKVSFNTNGKEIRDYVAYLPPNMTMYHVLMFALTHKHSPYNFFALVSKFPLIEVRSNPKAFPLLEHSEELYDLLDLKLVFASASGEIENVINFKDEGRFVGIDTSHKRFSICFNLKGDPSKIHCVQYDWNKNERMNVTSGLEDNEKVVEIHNTVDGGLLLLTTHCNDSVCYRPDHYQLKKMQVNGQVIKSIDIEDFAFNYATGYAQEKIFEIDDYLCVAKTCYSDHYNVKLVQSCFEGKDVY